jgi:hypothetical protein
MNLLHRGRQANATALPPRAPLACPGNASPFDYLVACTHYAIMEDILPEFWGL